MRFKTQAKVLGVKGFNGTIDGQVINQTTLFVETALDESRGTAKGFAVNEYKYKDESLFQSMKSMSYPHEAELELELVTSGRTQKTVVVGYKPITGTGLNRQIGEVKQG
ncbi:hypothetical protein [Jeongeupia chitinilytica]|uniref:Phage tail protein n=1 Tax=Jeongeupia chitinilytica TaxID=1041641 RepID=A0ABQ3GY41_9NEIS|nr:hypothetical protein [Jeongeupia chitinilytica]GHD60794.1 hypothetical protein GCM10007350_14380 [Jeongeupia chitinilytica]